MWLEQSYSPHGEGKELLLPPGLGPVPPGRLVLHAHMLRVERSQLESVNLSIHDLCDVSDATVYLET